jgi:hypothetical protein
MMQRNYDLDEILSRALRVAADSIEPAGDGLERIRARLTTPRPLPVAWLMASYTDVALPALIWLRSVLDSLVAWLRAEPSGSSGHSVSGHSVSGHSVSGHSVSGHSVSGHSASGHSASGHIASGHRGLDPRGFVGRISQALIPLAPGSLARRYGWLRPVAIAAAVIVAVAGGYGLTQLRSTMLNTGEQILPLIPGSSHTHGGSSDSHGFNPITGSSGGPSTGPGHRHAQPSSSASCAPGPLGPTPQPSATPSPTVGPTTTPTPTPSATPTTTPTGTPTDTPSASPSTTAVVPGSVGSPIASAVGVLNLGPADPASSPQPTNKTSPTPKPCGPVPGLQAPGQRTVPNPTRLQAAKTAS